MSNNPFYARWTQSGHVLCTGHWEVTYEGRPVTLPVKQLEKDMGTYGIYYFVDPEDEDFAEGLKEEDWVVENIEWLLECFLVNQIPYDEIHLRWFFRAVNGQDWRCGSCGGCM